jgi:uncharacterized protein
MNKNAKKLKYSAGLIFLLLLFLFPGYKIPLKIKEVVSNLLKNMKQLPISQTAMVPMRDNICLATDVYLPQGDGPWPVVLIRTVYGKSNYDRNFNKYLINNLYAIVIQDTRGRGNSEGIDTIFQTDGWGILQDGYDTCSWIITQAWCNGKIGTMGDSALGILQCLMAPTQPPGLVCQVIGFAPGDFYDDWAFPGDAPQSIWKYWLENQNGLWLYYMCLNHYPKDHWWDQFDFIKIAPLVTTPALHISGWYDVFTKGTIKRFYAWQKNGGPGAKGNQRLLIGSWTHIKKKGIVGCDDDLEEKSLTPLQNKISYFFDFWLKGEKNRLIKEPPIVYWDMMSIDNCKNGRWVKKIDLPNVKKTILYLHANQKLLTSPPYTESNLSFNYNPHFPWISKGGSTLYFTQAGHSDQNKELQKDHHLLFKTNILEKNVNVTGEIKCHLYVKTNVPSSDIVGILIDISPDGKKYIIADGIKRVKWYEESCLNLPLTKTDEGVQFSIGWVSYTFTKGHQIGIIITCGNWPSYERNPQNGKNFYNNNNTRLSGNNVYVGGDKQSSVILPCASF